MNKNMIALLIASAMIALPVISPAKAQSTTNAVEAAKTGRIATEVFGRKWDIEFPRLSPDGNKMVYQLAQGDIKYLAWIDLTVKGDKPKIIAKSDVVKERGDRQIVAYRFVGNDTIVVTLFGRENFNGQLGDLSRLVAYDINEKSPKARPLAWEKAAGDGASILHINHEQKYMIVQRQNINDFETEVIKVTIGDGKYSMVQRSNSIVGGWFTDGKGVVRGGFGGSRNGTQKMLYRSSGSGSFKTISKAKDKDFTRSGALVPSILLDEPDMAYAISNHEGYAKAYKVNLATQEFVETIKETPGYDVIDIISNNDGNDLTGFVLFNGQTYVEYVDELSQKIQMFLDDEFGKNNARVITRSEDLSKCIIAVSKPSQLSTFYYYDLMSGEFRLLGFQSNTLKNAELNPVEAVDYTARDGMKIQAIMTYPRHRTHRKNLPVIVMPHGGPFGVKDEARFDRWAQSMAEEGYVVIQPNYRGSSGYGTEFVKEGRKPDGLGNKMQDDLNDALAWFASTGLIDANRACIMGWSYGGYATARGAQRDPDLWKCAMAGAGVYDLPKMKGFDYRSLGGFSAGYLATAEDPVQASSARFTDGDWSPILIVAAARDTRIPLEQSRTLVSRLKGSGKVEGTDFKYIEQKKGTHNLPYEDVHIEWLEESAKWANRFNPAYIASDPDQEKPVKIQTIR